MANSIFINVGSGGGSGGGGASLPTAEKGMVLVSQGEGVPPIFSREIWLNNPIFPNNNWKISCTTDGNLTMKLFTDSGIPIGNRFCSIDPYVGGFATSGALAALNGQLETRWWTPTEQSYSGLAGSGAQNVVGTILQILDSTVNTPDAVVSVGGGTFRVLARWNGTNWKVIQ